MLNLIFFFMLKCINNIFKSLGYIVIFYDISLHVYFCRVLLVGKLSVSRCGSRTRDTTIIYMLSLMAALLLLPLLLAPSLGHPGGWALEENDFNKVSPIFSCPGEACIN